jgi:uncharacterized Zn finger protein
MTFHKVRSSLWGSMWIDSIRGIFLNRSIFKKGLSYTNQGAVLNIEFKGNLIMAIVQGKMELPFMVILEFPPFTEEVISRLMDLFREESLFMSYIESGINSDTLLDFLFNNNINPFIQNKNDIKSYCSCLEKDLCKHRSAIYYHLAKEIDKNPLLLFEWKGFIYKMKEKK